jgi:molybdopterin-guanine dinucleotide biosynthesis protein A
MDDVTGAVLAGGRSRRMGRDKALMDWGGRPLVEHVAARLQELCAEVFVVAKVPLPVDLRVVTDATDTQTPLAGVVRALAASAHRRTVVVACDMPYVSVDVLRHLLDLAEGVDAVVPQRAGRAEPLHAVWASSALGPLTEALASGERALHRTLGALRVRWVPEAEWSPWDPQGRTFENVNTPADVARWGP